MKVSKKALSFLFCWFVIPALHAAGMKPEVPALFLDASNREVTITVENTDNEPALLHSSLQTIKEDRENMLILSPQLVRVEAGKKQQVRVMLKEGVKIDKQRMQRINFISVPMNDNQKNRARILVGQNIPVILSPADLPSQPKPWTLLQWQTTGSTIQIINPSKYIVRLVGKVDMLPGKKSVNLNKSYILPGETITLSRPEKTTSARLYPVTRYGIRTEPFNVNL